MKLFIKILTSQKMKEKKKSFYELWVSLTWIQRYRHWSAFRIIHVNWNWNLLTKVYSYVNSISIHILFFRLSVYYDNSFLFFLFLLHCSERLSFIRGWVFKGVSRTFSDHLSCLLCIKALFVLARDILLILGFFHTCFYLRKSGI